VTVVATIALPGPAVAAAADAGRVWCLAARRLLAFDATGAPVVDVPTPAGARALAASGNLVAAAGDEITLLDPVTGTRVSSAPGRVDLVGGDGAVWAIDARAGRAWRLDEPGSVAVPGVVAAAPQAGRLWWLSREGMLHGGPSPIALEGAGAGTPLVACANSVWIGAQGRLERVGAFRGDLGLAMPVPEAPVTRLACAGGVLVAATGTGTLLVLDPSIDADVRRVDLETGGEIALLVATGRFAGVFVAGARELRLVAVKR
jgi:hypothetical protein